MPSSAPDKTFNVLICATGSVATIKLVELVKRIQSCFPLNITTNNGTHNNNINNGNSISANVSIRIVMTQNAKHFISKRELAKVLREHTIEIFDDADEWSQWKNINDPVLHIELRKWAHIGLIAPLDANTMAKLANGICDNLLTCVVRAWDCSKPLIYCPAMNVHMYSHPITRDHLCKLQSFGYLRVDCVEKRLACGDIGMGGMASVDDIAKKVTECLLDAKTSRLAVPSKPLLSQHPTYPIMSCSSSAIPPAASSAVSTLSASATASPINAPRSLHSRSFSSLQAKISEQLLTKIKSSNLSLNAIAKQSSSHIQQQSSSSQNANSLLQTSMLNNDAKRLKRSLDGVRDYSKNSDRQKTLPTNNNHNNNNNNFNNHHQHHNNNNNNNNNHHNQVNKIRNNSDIGRLRSTSLQNLRAINSDRFSLDSTDSDYGVPESDTTGFELDPSKLLEQSMTTDESNAMDLEHQLHQNQHHQNQHELSQHYHQKSTTDNLSVSSMNGNSDTPDLDPAIIGDLTPLFNTSKFLALCHNKERDCFTCTICKNDYKNRKSMARHLKEQHVQGNIYHCKPCGVSYKRREKLIKHNRERHPGVHS